MNKRLMAILGAVLLLIAGAWQGIDGVTVRDIGSSAELEASLAALAKVAIQADGCLADADPLRAIEDTLRTFAADELIISTHPPGRSSWLAGNVVERARERFSLPIAHVIVDLELERETRLVRPTPGARRDAT